MYIIRILAFCLLLSRLTSAVADFYSNYPPAVSDLSSESVPVNQYNWRNDVDNVYAPGGVTELPVPCITPRKTLHLTMKEAILLSLRNNPTIQSTELNRITDKFAVILEHHGFEPQYTLSASSIFAKGKRPYYSSTAAVTLKNTIGTQFGVNYTNVYDGPVGGPGQTSFSITQPLLKGFGRPLNMIGWFNTLDAENSARLGFKSSIMSQVVSVITAYRQLVEDYQSLAIQERTLKTNIQTVKHSELKVKVGQLARSDLSQQKATLETTRLSLLQQRSSLIENYQSFLTLLGLKSTAKVTINKKIDFSHMKVPSVKCAIHLALLGNVAYQQALIAIRATQRGLLTAKDATRWELNLTGNFNISGAANQPIPVIVNGVQVFQSFPTVGSPSLTMQLNIPLNDIAAKQGLIAAEIKIQQAKLALENTKLTLIEKITNEVEQIHNQILTIRSAEAQVEFQRQSLEAVQIKYRFGRTTTFEVNQIQDQLLSQETTLVSDRITLLNDITTLNEDLGLTLKEWGIKLRY